MRLLRWLGIATVLVEWSGFFLLTRIHALDLSVPISQYGGYSETKLLFGAIITVASIFCYAFSFALQPYYKNSVLLSGLAGVFFIITGWTSYVDSNLLFQFTHIIAAVLSMVFYTALIWKFARYTNHEHLKTSSEYFLVSCVVLSLSTLLATSVGLMPFAFTELLLILVIQGWLITANIILITKPKKIN